MRLLLATTFLTTASAFTVPWPIRPPRMAASPQIVRASTLEEMETVSNTTALADLTDEINGIRKELMNLDAGDIISGELLEAIELEAEKAAEEMIDDACDVDPETGGAADELCIDEEKKSGFLSALKNSIKGIFSGSAVEEILGAGDELEKGWEQRANASSLRRNAEVWKFGLSSVFKVLKARKAKVKGASDGEIEKIQIEAAEFIRDGLLRLGPSFVKLGQVLSTRTDVLPETYTDALKTLTDEVPSFSGKKAKEIVSQELGRPCDQVFKNFSAEPLKAASLGQVHTATYKGQKVAIKVQRSGLRELFDLDLKNLRKLAVLLDRFDPKSDGADRDWVGIYEESERQLYLEIDYLNEADNAERFARDFADIDYVRVPKMYREVSTPKVLAMEFVESFKLTDSDQVAKKGLDPKVLAKQVADSFLRQIIETGYFHADPHSGNLCVNNKGELVFYDFGQMDELKPNVLSGFRTAVTAIFAGGPRAPKVLVTKMSKQLVDGLEEAGVVSQDADRLAVQKLAKYFIQSFKNKQLGKGSGNIKEEIGSDLQTLTENNVFRFPSTFTFVFRAFASVDGIGKDLDKEFDIGKLSQPFIEKFSDSQNKYDTPFEKNFAIFKKATGLNKDDVNTALMQPRKVDFVADTLQSMAEGDLKIRVRSLENEKALERMALRQDVMEKALFATLLFNAAGLAKRALLQNLWISAGSLMAFKMLMASVEIKKFDKLQARYKRKDGFKNNSRGE